MPYKNLKNITYCVIFFFLSSICNSYSNSSSASYIGTDKFNASIIFSKTLLLKIPELNIKNAVSGDVINIRHRINVERNRNRSISCALSSNQITFSNGRHGFSLPIKVKNCRRIKLGNRNTTLPQAELGTIYAGKLEVYASYDSTILE